MASDDDYMAFLNKANADPNAGTAAESKKEQKVKGKEHEEELRTTDDGAAVPAAIRDAVRGAFYVSDADEPFVPVCLQLPSSTGEEGEGGSEREGLPDEGMCFGGWFCDALILFLSYLFFIFGRMDVMSIYLSIYLPTFPPPVFLSRSGMLSMPPNNPCAVSLLLPPFPHPTHQPPPR